MREQRAHFGVAFQFVSSHRIHRYLFGGTARKWFAPSAEWRFRQMLSFVRMMFFFFFFLFSTLMRIYCADPPAVYSLFSLRVFLYFLFFFFIVEWLDDHNTSDIHVLCICLHAASLLYVVRPNHCRFVYTGTIIIMGTECLRSNFCFRCGFSFDCRLVVDVCVWNKRLFILDNVLTQQLVIYAGC